MSKDTGLGGIGDVNTISIASVAGEPYIALSERAGPAVRVMHWNGTSWVAVGAPFESPSDYPRIADVGGTPYVAYGGQSNSDGAVLVKRWNTQTQLWEQVGSKLNTQSPVPPTPEITVITGVPYVAWAEQTTQGSNAPSVFVARLSGGAWTTVGPAIVTTGVEGLRSVSLANIQGQPALAWVEIQNPAITTHVVRWNGTAWAALGGAFAQNGNQGLYRGLSASLAAVGGVPHLVWFRDKGQAIVSSWNGTQWNQVGTTLNRSSDQLAGDPVITDVGGKAIVVWWEAPPSNETQRLFASRFDQDTNTAITSGPVAPTKDRTPTFTFSADPPAGAAYECSIDGAPFTACTTPYTTPSLADGHHRLSVRATSPGFATDPSPATRDFDIDTVAPSTVISVLPLGASSGKTSRGNFWGTVAATADEQDPPPGVGNGVTRCVLDPPTPPATYEEIPVGACPSPTTATLGTHTFYAASLDQAFNVGPVVSVSFRVVPAPPDTVIDSGPSGLTFLSTPFFGFHATVAGSTFECRIDSEAFSSCTNPFLASKLPSGDHSFEVRALNADGTADPTPAHRDFHIGSASGTRVDCEIRPFLQLRFIRAPDGPPDACRIWREATSQTDYCSTSDLCVNKNLDCPMYTVCALTARGAWYDADRATDWHVFVSAEIVKNGPPQYIKDCATGLDGDRCFVTAQDSALVVPDPRSINTGRGVTYCAAGYTSRNPPEFGADFARHLECHAEVQYKPLIALQAIASGSSIQLFIPGAGTVTIGPGNAPQGLVARTAGAKPAFQKSTRKVAKAGLITLKPRLSKTAKRILRLRGKLKITVKVTYSSPGGTHKTSFTKITLRPPRKGRRRLPPGLR